MSSVLKAEEVATQLGVTTEKLQQWRDEGTGPTWLLVGTNCVRYIDSSVVQWLIKQQTEKHPEVQVKQFGTDE